MTSLYENEAFMAQVGAAQAYVTSALDHEVWSRDLDDNIVSYAFCVPPTVYNNKRLCRALRRWLTAVFAYYEIAAIATWRPSSVMNEYGCSMYEADWCGSRSRSVNIGPHLYMELDVAASRGDHSGAPPPIETLWHTYCTREDCYNDTMRVVVAADKVELDFIKAKQHFLETVVWRATTEGWRRLHGKRIPVAANYPNDWSWPEYEWTRI
jgi:hypothetical protein